MNRERLARSRVSDRSGSSAHTTISLADTRGQCIVAQASGLQVALPTLSRLFSRCMRLNGERLLAGLPFHEFNSQAPMLGNLLALIARQPQQNIDCRGSHLIFWLMDGG